MQILYGRDIQVFFFLFFACGWNRFYYLLMNCVFLYKFSLLLKKSSRVSSSNKFFICCAQFKYVCPERAFITWKTYFLSTYKHCILYTTNARWREFWIYSRSSKKWAEGIVLYIIAKKEQSVYTWISKSRNLHSPWDPPWVGRVSLMRWRSKSSEDGWGVGAWRKEKQG